MFNDSMPENRHEQQQPESAASPLAQAPPYPALSRGTFKTFFNVIFKRTDADTRKRGRVALRGFEHFGEERPLVGPWCKLDGELLTAAVNFAGDVARRSGKAAAVFSPPVCLFGDLQRNGKRVASEENVICGPTLMLELDERPNEMLAKAEQVLGSRPTVLVRSGGVWDGPNGPEEKLHAYWRLSKPAVTPKEREQLRWARRALSVLCGGDGTAAPLCHPLRWPGSWHTKAAPRLATMEADEDVDVDLSDAIDKISWWVEFEDVDLGRPKNGLRPRREGFKTKTALQRDTLLVLARAIPNPEGHPWDAWSNTGLAFYDASHGSPDGLEAFDVWSAFNSKYDPDVVENRWSHWHSYPPDNLSVGTLVHLARRHDPDVVIPLRTPLDVSAVFEPLRTEEAPDPAAGEPDAASDILGPDYMRRLNRSHAFVMNNGQATILNHERNGTVTFSNRRSFEDRYANDTVLIDKKEQSIASLWMKDPRRRSYVHGVEFSPGGVRPGVFNLWQGFNPTGGPGAPGGSCELIVEHIRSILCAGDAEAFSYLIGWLAHMVQRPQEKPGVCIVLKGEKGAGKDMLGYYLDAMMPGLRFGVSQQEQVTGRFNGHLAAVLLLHIEEAIWAGSKPAESALKSLITSPTLSIEYKGLTPFTVQSKLRLLMTSNEEWVVPASDDERRFFVSQVSSAKRQNTAYFKAIVHERENGGAAALLRHLRETDLSNLDVRHPPNTAGLQSQKRASLRAFDLWWFEQLSDGAYWSDDGTAVPVERDRIFGAYRGWHDKQRHEGSPWTRERVGRRLRELMPQNLVIDTRPRTETGRTYAYQFPALAVCRQVWSDHYGVSDAF